MTSGSFYSKKNPVVLSSCFSACLSPLFLFWVCLVLLKTLFHMETLNLLLNQPLRDMNLGLLISSSFLLAVYFLALYRIMDFVFLSKSSSLPPLLFFLPFLSIQLSFLPPPILFSFVVFFFFFNFKHRLTIWTTFLGWWLWILCENAVLRCDTAQEWGCWFSENATFLSFHLQ